MKNKGDTISKANFIFKCHVEIGQGRESTEKGNYTGKEAQSNVQEDAPLVLIYVNTTPIRDSEVDPQVCKQAAQEQKEKADLHIQPFRIRSLSKG